VLKPGAEWLFHLSGFLCLDLANTVSWRGSGRPIERLARYEDLLAWGRQTKVLTEREVRRLAAEAKRRPADTARALAGVITVREAMYRIFAGLAHRRVPAATDLAALNTRVAEALAHLAIAKQRGRFAWTWSGPPNALDRVVWPAIRSAAVLLTSDELGKLRTCGAANCGWVFLDTTKNRSRRWCDMRVCGNRAKVRRYYARQRA
jgi:predicted RNA-binding Zn ribbon-like protein